MRSSISKQRPKRKPTKTLAAATPSTNGPRERPRPPFAVHTNVRILGLMFVLLGLATLALYSPVLHNPFIDYDDPDYVTQNLYVRAGLSWQLVKWWFATTAAGNWHPVTWLSHGLDCQLFGLNAGGHHATSALLHAANGILLFIIVAGKHSRSGSKPLGGGFVRSPPG